MKNRLFDKQSLFLLISVISISVLCIISVSYAYFTTQIKGNEDATPIELVMGTMKIKFEDSDIVTLDKALPGDSVTHKFKVTNTGTLAATYNIKLEIEQNDFGDKKDLVYTLKKNGTESEEHILPYTDSYILTNAEIAFKGEDNYELIVKFKEDQENKDQNDNKQKHLKFKIVVDSQTNVEESYLENNTFFMKLEDSLNLNQATFDDFNNLRYIGLTPNNYIWFNCDQYDENMTNENANQAPYNCEKWRIIGLFNNVEKVNEDGSTTKENLVKIVRAESLTPTLSWDNKDTSTGAESIYGKNDWTTAELMYLLNPNNNEHKLNEVTGNNSLYWNSESGNCSNGKNNATTTCDFTSTGLKKSGSTKSMIEHVKWNLGGTPNYNTETTQGFYSAEHGTTAYTGRPTTWNGEVGLIYPSDYGYATAGGTNKTRQECLDYRLYGWSSGDYQTDCAGNDWLKPSSGFLWTLTTYSDISDIVFTVADAGNVHTSYAYNVRGVSPSLYLSSKVGIKEQTSENENPYGSENNPFILEIEQ